MKMILYAIPNIPIIKRGDNVGKIIYEAARAEGFIFQDGDIVVVASKIVSRAEGRLVDIRKVKPSTKALKLAEKLGVDPRYLEVILSETERLLIVRPDLLLTEHRLGFICTKAGVDRSNVAPGQGKIVALIPEDPDGSAQRIRETIQSITGKRVAVIINDTFGRPYRIGSVGMAIGISGIAALYTEEAFGLFGRKRHVAASQVDEIAAAASLLMGQTKNRPVIVVRGLEYQPSETDTISEVLRSYDSYKRDILEMAEQIRDVL
jgi:coenzyme F420-0:L-glutamate ligase/coenzyme F420-1:gamma-L-glutamate ligase